MTKKTVKNRPTHRVYAVVKDEGAEKGTWFEMGAAWPHKDGKGYSIMLKHYPLPKEVEIVIRAIEPKAEAKGGAQ